MIETKDIENLMKLFRGSTNAYGTFVEIEDKNPLKPKVKGRAITVPQGPTFKNWKAHCEGSKGLGIVPITEDDMCYWGVLDVDRELDNDNKKSIHDWECLNDDGSINHTVLQKAIQKLKLPLVCCYSKSKSAHCFLFVEEAIPAQTMRSLLEEIACKLGVGGCEIFPKQDRLDRSRGDLGNWLNMPYFGETRKGVILIGNELKELELPEFIEHALSKQLSKEQLENIFGTLRTDISALEDVLAGAPPCLQYILKRGVTEGTRNNVLFNVAVYCRRKYGEDFRTQFQELHTKFIDEPLGFKELETICISAEKKNYQYQCKSALLKKYCNATVCMDREAGIDFSSEIKTLKSATRILSDPVVYAVEVEMEAGLPSVVYVETDQLFSQDQFRKECSFQLHKTFIPLSTKAWDNICVRLVNTAINQEPPYDMTADGQMFKYLQDFIVNRAQGRKQALQEDEGVWLNTDTKKIYFKLDGFKSYAARKGYIPANMAKWKLNRILLDLQVLTDEIDAATETCVRKPLGISEERIRLGRGFIRCRAISAEAIRLEELQPIVDDSEDIV